MKPFLSLVAHDLYVKLHGNLSHTVVVFPSKRASLFFNQYLVAEGNGRPLFAPTYMTLGELFGSLTTLRTEEHIRLVCLLHRHFNQCTGQNESIDSFYSWGELLLSDFDDIDKNLVNPDILFRNLKNYKELTSPNDYLTDEQLKVLEKFFDGFRQTEGKSVIRENFIRVWQAMAPIYQAFRRGLEAEGRAYEGQLFRQAVEQFDASRLTADNYVFVGFNVLSAVERRLFDLIHENGKARFYWDYDHYYFDSQDSEAGTFIRINISRYGNELDEKGLSSENPYDNLRQLPRIDIISAPTDNAQASFVYEWVKENLTETEQETAVVLADEKLIMPVLHALPMESVHDINVTMGMPMTETSVYRFLTELVEERLGERGERIEVRDLREIGEAVDGKGLEMKKLEHRLQEEEEALYRAHLAVNSLVRLVGDGTLTASGKLISRLLMTILRGTTIPFHGEPARGLQVMGVLETRNLDFTHLLVLSANEGMLPKPPSEVSFIPFSLRKAFGLTTIERQTAVYAYYFYRLIQRARQVTLVYNSGTDGMNKKVPSRFITQLEVESESEIRHFALQSDNTPVQNAPICVEQTAETRRKLIGRFTKKRLSPTAINDYYTCRLKFYLKHVEGLEYDEENTEEVTKAQFGTLFHRSAELAYERLTAAGPIINRSELLNLAKDEPAIRRFVHQAFKEKYWKSEADDDIRYSGIHFINFKAICMFLGNLLRFDADRAPFTYIQSERSIEDYVSVATRDGNISLRLGGYIDRLDEKDGITSVIDYKTGGKKDGIQSIQELFDPEKDRKKYVFQAFFYSWLLSRKYKEKKKLFPQLFYVNHMKAKDFDPAIKLSGTAVTDFQTEAFEEFDKEMTNLLTEIFNSDTPYTQVQNEKKCKYCDFCAICGRKPKEY